MDLLQRALLSYSSDKIAEFLTIENRNSIKHQNECIWTSFVKFIRYVNPTYIGQEHFLQFLIFLFPKDKRAPSTIKSNKSFLIPIFKYLFCINISDTIFNFVIKVFSIKSPGLIQHSSTD